MSMHLYAGEHDGWFPSGGSNEWDSLAKVIDGPIMARCATSHELAKSAVEFWSSNKTLSADVCCYHYNEGLRRGDDQDLVLMYYEAPTRWANHSWRTDVIGRPIYSPGGFRTFVPEAEFQRLQSNTVQFLAARKAKQRPK